MWIRLPNHEYRSHRHEYHWMDGVVTKKPLKCSAPEYVDYLMSWVQAQLDDESVFPSKIGQFLPSSFMSGHRHQVKHAS